MCVCVCVCVCVVLRERVRVRACVFARGMCASARLRVALVPSPPFLPALPSLLLPSCRLPSHLLPSPPLPSPPHPLLPYPENLIDETRSPKYSLQRAVARNAAALSQLRTRTCTHTLPTCELRCSPLIHAFVHVILSRAACAPAHNRTSYTNTQTLRHRHTHTSIHTPVKL